MSLSRPSAGCAPLAPCAREEWVPGPSSSRTSAKPLTTSSRFIGTFSSSIPVDFFSSSVFSGAVPQRRTFASNSSSNLDGKLTSGSTTATTTAFDRSAEVADTTTSPSVDETLDKLFADSNGPLVDATLSNAPADAWFAAAETTITNWTPVWYNLADQAVVAVKAFHDISGLEYGWSIVGVTIIMRLGLFPLMVQSQRTTSRMAHLQPDLQLMKTRYEAIGTPSRQDQLQFSKQVRALFEKYQVKPLRGFLAPVVQLPLFMGMFFGLKKMPSIYHDELAVGGMFWFVDLTVPDPLYILPLASAGTFLALIEMGKTQMMAQDAAQGQLMINFMRILSLAMLPVCFSFESSMLCYWTANNILTMAQTGLLQQQKVRKYFGIWDPPKPVPGMQPETLTDAASNLIKRMQGEHLNEKEKMERHNQTVEVKKKAKAFGMMRRSREQQRTGITGKRVN